MKTFYRIFFIAISLSLTPLLYANTQTDPTGLWKTDNAILKIYSQNGELRANVQKILNKSQDTLCEKCTGNRKDKRIVGMNVMWGLKSSDNGWDNGQLLDPKTGNIYNASLTLSANGQQLKVHVSRMIIGKTITWNRVK